MPLRAVLLSAAMLLPCASTSLAPDTVNRSCKPQPPYSLEMTSAGDSQWTLTLRNSSTARDVVIWMWSEIDEATGKHHQQQKVWSGTLESQERRSLRVEYKPTANTVRVWASIESPDQPQAAPEPPTIRALAVTPWNVTKAHAGTGAAVLTEDPATGRRVIQYVGQGGLQ